MAMPSALIGFSTFKVLSKYLSFPFTPIENVLIQTVAGAVGTMPLGCGFVGVIPALEFLLTEAEDDDVSSSEGGGAAAAGPLKLNFWKLCIWSLGVCLFGVVFAVPLRREVIIREKLKFPSGTAAAWMLNFLHGKGELEKKATGEHDEFVGPDIREREEEEGQEQEEAPSRAGSPMLGKRGDDDDVEAQADRVRDWKAKMRLLIGAFLVSGVYVRLSIHC